MGSSTCIADNVKRVRDSIAEATLRSGRSPGEITLVAASKTQSADSIRQAIAAGVDATGENRVQEMLGKHAQGAYSGAPLHFIGNIQSNKAARIVGVCDLIESVDSTALVSQIGRKAVSLGITQKILIEVNVAGEPQKSGILPGRISEILELAAQTEGIKVLGLMAIPPISVKNDENCNYFDVMYQLYIDISEKKYDNVSMQVLSMGMSDSYTDALLAGSNMVRIGTAIFGRR